MNDASVSPCSYFYRPLGDGRFRSLIDLAGIYSAARRSFGSSGPTQRSLANDLVL